MKSLLILCTLLLTNTLAQISPDPTEPPSKPSYGSNFTYPYPVHHYIFPSQRQNVSMAYMDVSPSANATANNQTVVLMHGKNFCGATWNATIHALSSAGYRVIAPDQIGWCKSSKLERYQFSLSQLSQNTLGLLDHLGLVRTRNGTKSGNITLVGHSMGGMTAARFALSYPDVLKRLVLVNPVGLEDWKALGVPYLDVDSQFVTEKASNFSSIKAYEQSTYYANTWSSDYDIWVQMLANTYADPVYGATFAWDMALITDAVFTQPVIYEFPLIRVKTLLMIGDLDNTAIGKQWAPNSVKPLLGHYNVLGKKAAQMINGSTLVEFPDLGHAPQIQAPDRFHTALLDWLGRT